MKIKLITPIIIALALSGIANAATVSTAALANSTVGLITAGLTSTVLSGTAYIYVSTTELSALNLQGVTTRSGFEALLATGTSTPLRSPSFTSGVLASGGNLTLTPGDKSYLFIDAGSNGYGLYQGPNVPALGALTLNPATMTEDLIGTSNLTTVGSINSGFQLVPEPSTTLLGAFGALALLRRRRN